MAPGMTRSRAWVAVSCMCGMTWLYFSVSSIVARPMRRLLCQKLAALYAMKGVV